MSTFTAEDFTVKGAAALDAAEPNLRSEFVIPTRSDIASKYLQNGSSKQTGTDSKECIYLCGNSLGLQPARTATRIRQYLDTWATKGVSGHFTLIEDSPLPEWLNLDQRAAQMIAPIVGASAAEVAAMETLTANLHLLMSAFYHPDVNGRHKIILESKAFPSDHFVVETQIRNHGLDPATSMVCIEPHSSDNPTLTTNEVCSAISKHAESTAILLLPGIQYYTGQLFDIATVTRFAHNHGIFVIWDLAHAVGNVPLKLHDWDVDAAAWCSYKYLNGGAGCIAGLFVHERNSEVGGGSGPALKGQFSAPRRLGGWWGNSKSTRFNMATEPGFQPVSGAAGFQLGNPSALDTTSLCASLEVFEQAGGIHALRKRSLQLTSYLEALLNYHLPLENREMFRIITPKDPKQRGAQLCLLLVSGSRAESRMLEIIMEELGKKGVVVDERRPNVIRVAPAPLYNTFSDVYEFVEAFGEALDAARTC